MSGPAQSKRLAARLSDFYGRMSAHYGPTHWWPGDTDFEIAIGLPVTFADIGLEGVTRERLKKIGDICAGPGSLCHMHPFKVTSDSIVDAMIAADALGRARKKLAGVARPT